MQIVGNIGIMRDYAEKVQLEKVKTLKDFAISRIKALPEIGSSELLYNIVNLMSGYNQK